LLELKEQIEDEDNEDPSLRDKLDDLTRDVFLAYVEREAGHVKEHLESKGAAFFAASATSSLDWRDRMRRSDPWLSPEASAVPAITRHFLSLPASTNLSKYRDHVYRVLAAFRARCGRVLKKHIEDQHYARVRKDFSSQIPTLRIRLEKVVPGTVENAVALPWSKNDEPDIRKGIKSLFIEKWIHPLIFVSGWGKMLRENGIPVDGKYSGRNLNEEILHTMESRIDEWSEGMTDSAEAIAQAMYKPVQDALETVKSNLQSCTATPELTEAATEALEEMSEEVEMVFNNLQDKLQRSLDDTHLRFTTEIDVECPIAQTMKPSYKRASDPKFVLSGKGIYNRQRKVLKESMLKPKRHYTRLERGEERIKPLLQTLNEKLVSRQNEVWKEDCTSFIGETTELLETFSKTMEDLLTDAAFMKEDHRKAREELKRLLGTFDDRLEEVQNEFVNLEPQHPAKKVKVENQEEPLSATAPGTVSETSPETGSETVPETTPESAPESAPEQPGPQDPVPNTTPATTSDTDSAPISQNFGWHHFLANMHPLGSA
jgi:gas vesicle protein